MSRPSANKRSSRGKQTERRTLQLCRQVAEELQLILLSECDDDMLRELTVESVLPAPHASRLIVTVASPAVRDGQSLRELLLRLEQKTGMLRSEVARAVTRKRAPELLFQIRPTE